MADPVSDPREMHRQACAAFIRRLELVQDEQWTLPTPCSEWTVRDLVGHVVGGNTMARLALNGLSREDILAQLKARPQGDLVQLARSSADQAIAAFDEPGALERTAHHPARDMPGVQLLALRTLDVFTHTWDLARAVGGDEQFDPLFVDAVYAALKPMMEGLPRGAIFAPAVELSEPKTKVEEMMASLGRDPRRPS